MALLSLLVAAVLSACAAMHPGAPSSEPTPSVYQTRTVDLSRVSPSVTVVEIGRTGQGRPIRVLRIAGEGDVLPDHRPALLVVAGLDGDHRVGVDVALGLAQSLEADHADLLTTRTVYVVPGVNLDALARHEQHDLPARSFIGTFTPDDADRDGRIDEDGPEDINGDGVISMMRVENPPPGSDLVAEWVLDPDEPRLLVKPDEKKGESGTHALLVEGRDADGDGSFVEDGIGSVLLDNNFPYRWPAWADGAGRYQLSEPETLSLVNWMLSRDNIIAVLTFGPYDTLVKIPEAGKKDATGHMTTGIEDDDKPEYEAISELFKDATGMTEAPTADSGGSFRGWAYANFGVFSFSTPVWVRPDLVELKEPEPEDANGDEGEADADDETPSKPVKKKKGDDKKSDDAKWLAYSDEDRGGEGFIDWTEFDHPQLGKVEIGGFVPGFKLNPPDSEIESLVAQQTRFVADLLGKFPDISVDGPIVERLDDEVWRISLRVRNDGFLPTRSASGVRARRIRPMIVFLELDDDHVIAGRRATPIESIAGGDSHELEWTVMATAGTPIVIRIDSPEFGERSLVVTVGEEDR